MGDIHVHTAPHEYEPSGYAVWYWGDTAFSLVYAGLACCEIAVLPPPPPSRLFSIPTPAASRSHPHPMSPHRSLHSLTLRWAGGEVYASKEAAAPVERLRRGWRLVRSSRACYCISSTDMSHDAFRWSRKFLFIVISLLAFSPCRVQS
eukprot:1529082-Rhodomonas_salina.2